MTRMYIQPSFVDSCSDHGEWSGGNGQYRGDRSVEVVPTYINGRPNVRAFSDEAIEARREKKKTSVPLKSRILPQASRVEKLRSEAIELEAAFKAGEFTAKEYTLLRDVAFKKLRRSEELLKKATTLVEKEPETDEVEAETTYSSCDVDYTDTPTAPSNWLDDFIAELPEKNCFKGMLKIALHMTRKAVEFSQRVKAYYQTLKAV